MLKLIRVKIFSEKVDVSAGDRKILWRLNYARYERYMRDEMVIDLYRTNDLLDQHCLKTVHALIKVGEQRISHTHLSSFAVNFKFLLYYHFIYSKIFILYE